MIRPMILLAVITIGLAGVEPFAEERADFDEAIAELIAAYGAEVGEATKEYSQDSEKRMLETIEDLEREAAKLVRSNDLGNASIAWREVLRLRPDHPDARAFFEALGTLDTTLEAVLAKPTAIERDFTQAVIGEALTWPEEVREALLEHEEELAEFKAEYEEEEAEVRAKFVKAEERLRSRYVRAVERIASRLARSGDLPGAAQAWEEVLFWDRDHGEALAFFAALGTKDDKLASMAPEPDAAYFLGEPGEPEPGGFFGLTAEGTKCLLVQKARLDEDGLAQAIHDRLTERGMTITVVDNPSGQALEDFDLVIGVRSSDTLVYGMSQIADYSPTPLLIIHPKLMLHARVIPNNNQYTRPAGTQAITIAAPDHPVAARLSGDVAILKESPAAPASSRHGEGRAAARAERLEARQRGEILEAFIQDPNALGDGVAIATVNGGLAAAAWDVGAAFGDPSSEHERDETRRKQETALGRTVGLYCFSGVDPELITPEGWRLFDASVAWLLATPKPTR